MDSLQHDFQDWLGLLGDMSLPDEFIPDEPPTDEPQILPTPTAAALRVRGADAGPFLNNLLSCELPDDAPRRGALCNPKGRILATLVVAPEPPDGYLLILSRDLLAPLTKRLGMYVLRSKVEILATEADEVLLGIAGHTDHPAITALRESGTVHPHPGSADRMWGCFRRAALESWFNDEGHLISTTSPWAWRDRDIRQGLPTVMAATTEQFIPQMVNLDLVGAVSFSKGCYPGQEIIARMRYLGRIKRRMVRFSCSARLSAGAELRTAPAAEPAGQVVDAVPVATGSEGLAVIQVSALAHAIVPEGNPGAVLRLMPPPYEVPELLNGTLRPGAD